MVISFATKVHMLLVLVVIGIALYMLILYREVKVFQDEIFSIQSQVKRLSMSLKNLDTCHMVKPVDETVVDEPENIDEISEIEHIMNTIDNVSPAYQEIDETVDAVETVATVETVAAVSEIDEIPEQEPVTESIDSSAEDFLIDYSNMTVDELKKTKIEDLKTFLKLSGQSVKGTKAELIKRIADAKTSE